MNKLTTTLAGLALVAGASIAPAFAQGSFTTNGPFTFTFTPTTTFSVTNLPVAFNSNTDGTTSGFLNLFGGTEVGTSAFYRNVNLSFSPTIGGASTITDTLNFATVNGPSPVDNTFAISSVGISAKGDSFNLTGGTPTAPAVPEASTVISFGALLALGGVAVLRRKAAVKNAA